MVNLTHLYFQKHLLHTQTRVSSPLAVAASICGINAQRGVTIYLSCWNRIHNFRKGDLDKQLYQTRQLVKMWCMRGTVHIVPSDQFFMYKKATNPARLWLPSDVSEDFCEKVVKVLDEPLTKSQIADRIQSKVTLNRKELRIKVGRAVRMLGYKGVVVFGNPLGKGFHFKEYEFALVRNWLPGPESITEEKARKILLSTYLKCYGPAKIQDFAYWAGFTVGEARKVLHSVNVEEIEIGGNPYYTTPGDVAEPEKELENQIALLPEYDSYVMGHKDKSRIIKKNYKKQVFLPFAAVAATIVKNGQIIGTWKMKKDKTLKFQINPFEKLEEDDMCSIHEEIEKIAQFMGLEHDISL